jgi:hypothetical protein
MLAEAERIDRQVWAGHSYVLEDFAHAAGGFGLALLLYPSLRDRTRPLGYALVGLSALLHLYAYLTPRT